MPNSTTTKPPYPKHTIPPNRKDKKWGLEYAKAFYHEATQLKGNLFYTGRGGYQTNVTYALGQQDIGQYKLMIGVDDTQRSTVNTNWDIVPVIPKFVDITVGNMQKRAFNIECNAIDPTAQDAMKEMRAKMEAEMHLRHVLEQLSALTGANFQGDFEGELPESTEEIELQMLLRNKLKIAIDMEDGLELLYYMNNWEQVSEQIDRDLVIFGCAGIKDYTDPSGLPRFRRIDPRNLLTRFSKTADFSTCDAFGEVLTMTLAEFEKLAGHEFSTTEKENIYELFAGKEGNRELSSEEFTDYSQAGDGRFGSAYDQVVLKVLDFEFLSPDKVSYQKQTNKYGNTRIKQAKGNQGTYHKSFDNWYKGKWIIGSDYLFDFGPVKDQKIPPGSLEESKANFHLIAPGMIDMNNTPLTGKMIPVADDIQLNIIKLRQAIARARAKGLLIEIGGLENIPKGKGGEVFRPLELIAMYNETGNLLYRRHDDQGNVMAPPMQELENGMARDVLNYLSIINFNLGLLRDATGINEVADASTPDPDLLKGVAELAVQSTNNALHQLFFARRNLFERLSRSLVMRLQQAIKKRSISGYARAMGATDYRLIQVNGDISLHEFGIMIEEKPDERERMLFEQQLNTALQQRAQTGSGGITVDVYYRVKAFKNLKHAQQYLAFMVKKIKKEDEQRATRDIELNAVQQRESAKATSEAKLNEIRFQTDETIRLEKEKALITEELEKSRHERKMEEIRLQKSMEKAARTNNPMQH